MIGVYDHSRARKITSLELLSRIESRSVCRCRLYVITPFVEAGSRGWRAILAAARTGAVVSLITRSPASVDLANEFHALRALGGRTVFRDNLHAKALLWFGNSTRDKAAFVGSHNFTLASERHSVELGLFVVGEGPVEDAIYRDLKTFISELMNPRTLPGWRRTSASPRCSNNRNNFQRRTKCH